MVPNVLCTHVSCTPSMCLPITVVSSLNTQATSRLYLSINIHLIFTWDYELFKEGTFLFVFGDNQGFSKCLCQRFGKNFANNNLWWNY